MRPFLLSSGSPLFLKGGRRLGLIWVCVLLVFLLFFHHVKDLLVENNGFEPLTPCLQSRCSSQLS